MIILKVLLWWLLSELVAWGFWWFLMQKIYVKRTGGESVIGNLMNIEMDAYPKTQKRWIEWLRFVIWPYGIIQRTVVIRKIYKDVVNCTN